MLRMTLLLAAAMLTACPSSSTPVTPDEGPTPAPVADAPDAGTAAPPTTPSPTAGVTEARAAAAASNAFGLDLYARLRAGEGNRFFSPISLSTALTMTSLGAAGDTERELRAVLHLPDDGAHEAFAALQAEVMKERGDDTTIAISNRLWGQSGYGFVDAFLADTKRHYGAGLEGVDFAAPDAARQTINTWVSEQTREKIPALIPPGLLTDQTKLVLTNAVYFKGIWQRAFEASRTVEAPFAVTAERSVQAQLMHQQARFEYAEDDRVQVLAMPYTGADMALVVVLPKAADGLAAVEATLAADLPGWLDQLGTRKVEVYFPRFELRAKAAMNEALRALGVKEAFTMGADFTRMSSSNELYLSAVVHEAYVKVDERGTEAAAATGVVMGTKSAEPMAAPVFRADHPFFFALRDDRTGALLFLGRVVDPTAG